MVIPAPIIFLSVFVFVTLGLFIAYKYGIRRKSYEEDLAEYRKQASVLLNANKPKPKEKKNKKAAKKINKEIAIVSSDIPDDVEPVDSKPEHTENIQPQSKSAGSKGKVSTKQNKTHVEFKEEPEEVPVEMPIEKEVKEIVSKKEDIHKPEPTKEEKKPEKVSKKNKHKQEPHQQVEKLNPATEGATVEKEKPKVEKAVENTVLPLVQEPVINSGKEKKKKKNEFNSRPQMTAEHDQLIQSVRHAELSRNEVQSLIDLLLNKQLEAPAVIDEWSEGKSDPVQKLKKQLADKEKQLADEQEALSCVQTKLKEVRNEQLTERALLQQRVRAAEESRAEILTTNSRMQQKIQELEEYRKEVINFQRVLEENKALQIQRGQLEATLMNYQETEAWINTLRTENTQLNKDLQLLTQERDEHVTNYQSCILQNKKLQEELRFVNNRLEDVKKKVERGLYAQEEARKLAEQLQTSSKFHIDQEQMLEDTIEQLKTENRELLEKVNLQINGSSDESKEHEVQVLNLSNKLSSVSNDLSSVNQALLEAERKHQIDISLSQEKYDQLKDELEEQKNKNNELRKKNWKVMEALNAAESRNKSASNKSPEINTDQVVTKIKIEEQEAHKEFLQRLFPEIDGLKSENSDEFEQVIRQYISELQQKPATPPSPDKNAETVTGLQSELQHYKRIIDETEGILKRLQSHVEQEEIRWRNQLSQKDAEIQKLGNHHIPKLQTQVVSLQNQLSQEIEAHSEATKALSEEVNLLKEHLRIERTKNSEAAVYQNGDTS